MKHAGCDVERAVEVGATAAKAYALLYIYVNIFNEDSGMFKELSIKERVRGELRPDVLKDVYIPCMPDYEKEFIRNWLSQKNGRILEEVLAKLVTGELYKELLAVYKEAERRGVDLFDSYVIEVAKRLEKVREYN